MIFRLKRVCVLTLQLLMIWTLAMSAEDADSTSAGPDFENWDVTVQYGSADTVTFSVNEGSWMNLDVSPDGTEIVFDMLGDIYKMPITGGEATLLSGGLPFEVQPRFSPDGSKISFTSDRGAGDNIWVMNRDGSEPRQVTKEMFRLLNNAVWSPDGNYLIARKHFTSRRSLGAGEMWMYHISGGDGIQLTKRKNDQQDAGEPVMSPDGKYLYFSEDMSGGSTFQYNKDPNTQLYFVRRYDFEKGKLTNFIARQGGSVRPQISPDGGYLAFVRRVRSKSVLYLHQFSTGEEWPVYDGLNRDQQETWAIFGLYPNFSWTPDSKEIVIWAKGKIWRIDITTKAATEIPFTVNAELSLAKAIRYQQDVSPEEFTAKMLRHTTTSPDGKHIVFNAAGYLWKKKLPDGKPQRVTRDKDHFEFEPSFSPDGEWLIYTTWNDTALSAIRKVRFKGGDSMQLTERKGYYRTPSYSPDGTMIVYQRTGGDGIRGFAHGVAPGLYWIPAEDGGIGNLITEEGSNPVFNKTSDRIYYFLNGAEKSFKSVNLQGTEERTHFTSKYATQVTLSPDENWVAFQELFNAYIAPFPKTGHSADLSSKSKALPIKKVTRDAGNYLHWSKDSQKLHWSIGPEYFTRNLTESFDFVAGAADSIPPPDTTGIHAGLVLETDVPDGKIAITNARIITMKGDEVIENGDIVIERNRIAAIGSSGNVSIPGDAATIDASGKTIIPGMIDVHAHAWHFGSYISAQQHWPYFANLAFGVTAMHDPSATTEVVFGQSELVKAGRMTGPRIFSTGTILYGADGDFKAVINSLEDARSHMRRMKAVGAFSVKSYNQPRRDQRQQVLQAARELEMNVVPEGGSTFYHNLSMILDGHTGIEHNIPIAPVYDDVLNLWSASGTGYTPTLVVSYGTQSGERYWYQHTNVWENKRLLTFVPRSIIDARSRRRDMAPEDEYGHIEHAKVCKLLTDRGVKVNTGGHGQRQGLAVHWEMWMFAQGGMTPLEVIRTATYNGAYYIGMEDEIGSLETGKLADLVILEKNPLDDIRNTEAISHVMVNGRIYDAKTMNQIGNHPEERMPFYWEHPNSSDAMIWKDGVGFGQVGCGCHAAQ